MSKYSKFILEGEHFVLALPAKYVQYQFGQYCWWKRSCIVSPVVSPLIIALFTVGLLTTCLTSTSLFLGMYMGYHFGDFQSRRKSSSFRKIKPDDYQRTVSVNIGKLARIWVFHFELKTRIWYLSSEDHFKGWLTHPKPATKNGVISAVWPL